jgi:hypothetical protein
MNASIFFLIAPIRYVCRQLNHAVLPAAFLQFALTASLHAEALPSEIACADGVQNPLPRELLTGSGMGVAGKSLDQVAKIDRQLRQDFPQLPTPFPKRGPGPGIVDAEHERLSGEKTETFGMPDGRRVTQVTTPLSTYCTSIDSTDYGQNSGVPVRAVNGTLRMPSTNVWGTSHSCLR